MFERRHSGAEVGTVASQQEGPGFESGSGPFGVEFTCSTCVCIGFLGVLQLPPTSKTMQSGDRLIGD